MSADRYTTSDGVTLHIVEGGQPDGTAVVFLHGWTQSMRTWQWAAEALPTRAGVPVRTVRVDFRGHGQSDPAPASTANLEQCADDLAELISTRLPSGPLVLAGHSMGGMTVMALAERHPRLFEERIRGVALVSTSSGSLAKTTFGLPKPWGKLANHGFRHTRHELSSVSPPLLRAGLRWLLFGKRPQVTDISGAAVDLATCRPATVTEFRLSLEKHERTAALSRLRSVPTVLLCGLADRLTPYHHTRRMGALLPEARLVAYPGAGHMLPMERREEVTEQIARLVRAASDTRGVSRESDAAHHRPGADGAATAEILREEQL